VETEVEVEKLVEVPVDRIVYQDKIIYQDRESAVEVESLVYMEKVGKAWLIEPRALLCFAAVCVFSALILFLLLS
jgi:hypothetical protein